MGADVKTFVIAGLLLDGNATIYCNVLILYCVCFYWKIAFF